MYHTAQIKLINLDQKKGFILICFSKSYIHKWLPCFISPLHGEQGWLSGEKKKAYQKIFSTLLNTSLHFNLGQRVENGIWLIRCF